MNAGRSGKSGGAHRPGKPDTTDEDDALLWKRIADTTKPLPGRSVKLPAARAKQRKPAAKTSPPAPAAPPKQPERREPPKPPELRPGEAKGLDRRTAERLRRGQFPIEARIDLHGQTQAEAHRALIAFVAGSHKAGRRCVLVITGKGSTSGGPGRGVLRARLGDWLKEEAFRELVVRASPAHPRHGGSGAFYLFLKAPARKKNR